MIRKLRFSDCRRFVGAAYRAARVAVLPPLLNETLIMRRALGYHPNIRTPRTFNEKIAHRKHCVRDSRFALLADKYASRAHVGNLIGEQHLPKLYAHWSSPHHFDLSELPTSFVVKGSHNWGSTSIVFDKSTIHEQELLRKLRRELIRVSGRTTYEYWYRDIPRSIIVEELIGDGLGTLPIDYKFFVFHGQVRLIQLMRDRATKLSQRFYTPTWSPLELQRPHSDLAPVEDPPSQLSLMIELAERLATDLDFVRIDFFAPADGRVIFGEFTFAPAAGRRRFIPDIFDYKLGEYW